MFVACPKPNTTGHCQSESKAVESYRPTVVQWYRLQRVRKPGPGVKSPRLQRDLITLDVTAFVRDSGDVATDILRKSTGNSLT
jgi:hypothetical protein